MRTLKRLKKNKDLGDEDFYNLAIKCRGTNKKLLEIGKKLEKRESKGMVYKHIPSDGISQEECNIKNGDNPIEVDDIEYQEIEDELSEEIEEIDLKDKENNLSTDPLDIPIKYVKNNDKHITLIIGETLKIITPEKHAFDKILNALEIHDWRTVRSLMDTIGTIKRVIGKDFEVINNSLYRRGILIEGILANKIVNGIKKGVDNVMPYVKFLDKVKQNTDQNAVKGLYEFLKGGNIPITKTGNIVTYKKINQNWTDCYTGKISNMIGKVVMMPRENVDSNHLQTCSSGLHVASYDYVKDFGGQRLILCEVNPRDVCAVPPDYNNTKMRCCKYKVIQEVDQNAGEILKHKFIF